MKIYTLYNKITKGQAAAGILNKVLSNQNVSVNTNKMTVFPIIESVTTYGAESWSVNKDIHIT
jgi:hypothetical protein